MRHSTIIILALSLTGCGITPAMDARQKANESQASYRQCLLSNPKKTLACESARLVYELDAKNADDISTRLHSGLISTSAIDTSNATITDGKKVYSSFECTGPILMGVCHGSTIDNGAYHPTCHGEMLNGQCTGPLF